MTRPRRDPLKDMRAGDLDGVTLPLECRPIRGTKSYAIHDATGRQISRGYTDPGQVAERMERIAEELAARAKRKVRACLCCGASFTSQGPGHRLCNLCRRNPDRATGLRITAEERKALGLGPTPNNTAIPEGW